MKKKVYLIQINNEYGNDIYFPYSAGVIAAYAWQNRQIADNYELSGILFERCSIEKNLDSVKEPFAIGVSVYEWNFEYSVLLASQIKKKYPQCIVIFGGHQVAPGTKLLEQYGFIDFIIHGEGENSFCNILNSFISDKEVYKIHGIAYRTEKGFVTTKAVVDDIEQNPSPYLEGYFDFAAQNSKRSFSAILETNRGCPYGCAFCDWGNIKKNVRLFPIDKVKKEIEWMAKHKVGYCYCADGNFGLFERDVEIVEYLIEQNRKYGYPKKFQATYAKNNSEIVFKINKMLNDAGMSKGATLSFQSLSGEALKNIGRKNMSIEKYKELLTMYARNGIPTYSELILALPGETYDSFKNTLEQLIESGQHSSINVFNCEALVNAPMSEKTYVEKHGIQTVTTSINQYHVKPDSKGVKEYTRIVISTNTMSSADWKKANMLAVCMRVFHNLGLLQFFAIWLFKEKSVPYMDFYEKLLCWMYANPETVCGRVFAWLDETYEGVIAGHGQITYTDERFGELVWPLEEGAFLRIAYEMRLFYSEITDYLKKYGIDSELFVDLLSYQMNAVKFPSYLMKDEINLKYNLPEYFCGVYDNRKIPLERCDISVKFDNSGIPSQWADYAREIVWFGRRGGKNIRIGKIENV